MSSIFDPTYQWCSNCGPMPNALHNLLVCDGYGVEAWGHPSTESAKAAVDSYLEASRD